MDWGNNFIEERLYYSSSFRIHVSGHQNVQFDFISTEEVDTVVKEKKESDIWNVFFYIRLINNLPKKRGAY